MKRILYSSLVLCLLLSILSLSAQQNSIIQRCASDENLKEQIRQNPERGKSLEALEMRVEKMTNSKKPDTPGNGGGGGGGTTHTDPITRAKVYNQLLFM